MPSGEQVLAVIPHAELNAGLIGGQSLTHTLVLTDVRIIFARFTSAMDKELKRKPAPQKKRMSQLGSTADTSGPLIEKYLAMSPDDILAEHKNNFALERSDVTKVKLKYTGGLGTGTVAELLSIKTEERSYKLALHSSKQARKALQQAGLLSSTS